MIIEHEVIEQFADEPNGRPIRSVCDLMRQLGASDPVTILQSMWRAGYLAVVDEGGEQLAAWQCEQIWRERREPPDVRIMATKLGAESVWG